MNGKFIKKYSGYDGPSSVIKLPTYKGKTNLYGITEKNAGTIRVEEF